MAIYIGLAVGLFLAFMLILRVDWTPGRSKVIYHVGATVGAGTRFLPGRLRIEDGQIRIIGGKEVFFPLRSVRSVELFRQFGKGRMVRVAYDGDALIVAAVRFVIAGRFFVSDFFKTGKLAGRLSSLTRQSEKP